MAVLSWHVQNCSYMMDSNGDIVKPIFHRIWTTVEKSFVKWAPGWLYPYLWDFLHTTTLVPVNQPWQIQVKESHDSTQITAKWSRINWWAYLWDTLHMTLVIYPFLTHVIIHIVWHFIANTLSCVNTKTMINVYEYAFQKKGLHTACRLVYLQKLFYLFYLWNPGCNDWSTHMGVWYQKWGKGWVLLIYLLGHGHWSKGRLPQGVNLRLCCDVLIAHTASLKCSIKHV